MNPFSHFVGRAPLGGDRRIVDRLSKPITRRKEDRPREFGRRKGPDADGIEFGGERLPEGDEKLGTAFIGTTGSGKSTLIQLRLQEAVRRIGLGLGRRALVYDAKLDMLSILAAICPRVPVHLLNPFDARTSGWRLSEDILDPSSCLQVASIFIPENEALAQPYFENAARGVVTGVMTSFVEMNRRRGVPWDLRDVLLGCSPRYVGAVLRKSDQNRDLVQAHVHGREDTFKDVMSTVQSKLAGLRAVAALWSRARSTISLREWSRSESILVLGSNAAKSEAINPINRIVFNRLVDLLTGFDDCRDHRADPRLTSVFIDELAQLGRLPKLRELQAFGRSKGVALVLGAQEIEGLFPLYGRDTVFSLLGNVSYKAILRLESQVTADWAAALIGNERVMIDSRGVSHNYGASGVGGSVSSGQSYHEVGNVMAGELYGLAAANAQDGIDGFYLFPGAFKRYRFNPFTAGQLVPPASHVPNFVPAEAGAEYLADWARGDLDRLELSPATAAAPPPAAPPPAQPAPKAGRIPTKTRKTDRPARRKGRLPID